METVGKHVVADLSGCKFLPLYDNEVAMRGLLLECAEKANATVLNVNTHKFQPQGISAVVFLAESHISIHAWPDKGYVALDVYTCGDTTDPVAAVNHFKKQVGCTHASEAKIDRGLAPEGASSFRRAMEVVLA